MHREVKVFIKFSYKHCLILIISGTVACTAATRPRTPTTPVAPPSSSTQTQRVREKRTILQCHTISNGIFYSEVAFEGTDPGSVYPNDFWLPGSGVQRGSLYLGTGDPETPGYPSIPNVLRASQEEIAVKKNSQGCVGLKVVLSRVYSYP